MATALFVLFFWFDTGYRATPVTQEFNSFASCEAALTQFKLKSWKSSDGFCTKK